MNRDLSEAFRLIDSYIEEERRSAAIPGMALAITDREKVLHVSTFGHSNLSSRTPVSPETLFEIGSISKSFASVIALQLVEEGRLDLRKPMSEYLPWFEVRSSFGPITLHHLMSHTAGIVQGTETTLGAVTEVLALSNTDATAEPGTFFHYSNTGYKAVGLVLEKVLGESTGSALKKRVFGPLGMNSSESVITSDLYERLAVGYAPIHDDRPRPLNGKYVPATLVESDTADGSISSTASDMTAYMRMLLNKGGGPRGPLLSATSFDLLVQKVIKPADSVHNEYYGYGLDVREEDDHVLIGHTGGMVGFVSSMLVDMETGFGVIILVNCSSYDLKAELCKTILRVLRSAAEGEPLQSPKRIDSTLVENASEYEGTYASGSKKLQIVAKGKRLFIDGGAPVPLESRGKDEFFAGSPNYNLFLMRFGRKGEKVVEIMHGPDWYVDESYTGPKAFKHSRRWEAYAGHFRTHNPWISNFRIILRKGALVMVEPSGNEQPLTQLSEGVFRIGADARSPEVIRFDLLVDGKAMRATLSGCECYRFFK
jgi:CubicO group peptidase (beta-lactamase class C family)